MKIEESWAETFLVIFILIGFIISILMTNKIAIYVIVLLSGFLAGRLFYIKRFKEPIFPFVLMIIGFLFGYVLAGFRVSRFGIAVLFLGTFGISYYLHLKKIIIIFKSKNFVK